VPLNNKEEESFLSNNKEEEGLEITKTAFIYYLMVMNFDTTFYQS